MARTERRQRANGADLRATGDTAHAAPGDANLSSLSERLSKAAFQAEHYRAHIVGLATELVDIAEELDFLARRSAALTAITGDLDVAFVNEALGLQSPQAARMLLCLAETPAVMQTHADITERIGSSTTAVLKVYVVRIRVAYDRLGYDDPIRSIWGAGYMLSEVGAARLDRLRRKPAGLD